jgi:hypothetical protein
MTKYSGNKVERAMTYRRGRLIGTRNMAAKQIISFEVFKAVIVKIVVVWVVTPCRFWVGNGILEEHGASIFRVEFQP